MPSERFTEACSYFKFEPRRYYDESERRTKQHTFIDCARDGEPCVPGKFPDLCPDGKGLVIDLVVVGGGQVFEQLGPVTILTSLPEDLNDQA